MATGISGHIHFVFHVFILLFPAIWGRNHEIQLKDEVRQTIELSKFGFLQNGILRVTFYDMVVQDKHDKVLFGFSLEKTGSDGISPYMEKHSEKCILKDTEQSFTNTNQLSLALIKFDLNSEHITIDKYGKDFLNLSIENESAQPVLTTLTTVSSLGGHDTSKSPVLPSTAPNTAESSSLLKGNETANINEGNATLSGHNTFNTPLLSSTAPNTAESSSLPKDNEAANIDEGNTTLSEHNTSKMPVLTSTAPNTAASSNDNKTGNLARRKRRNAVTLAATPVKSHGKLLPLMRETNNVSEFKYSGNFVVQIKSKAEEGLYNLYFHNCRTTPPVPVTIQIKVEEKNGDNYLSAGEN